VWSSSGKNRPWNSVNSIVARYIVHLRASVPIAETDVVSNCGTYGIGIHLIFTIRDFSRKKASVGCLPASYVRTHQGAPIGDLNG
jgi:hypothetical protein